MYVLEAVWAEYIQYMTFTCLTQRSQSGMDNHNRRVHGLITTHTGGSVSFISHAKRMVGFFFITSNFFISCFFYINIFNWQHFFYYKLQFLDVSQARWSFLLKRMCGVITVKKRYSSSLIVKLSTSWYVGFQSFFS